MKDERINSVFTPILIGGSLILLISFAIRSTFGLFQIPIASDFLWNRSEFSLAIAIQNLAWGVGTPLFSAFAEKYGDRKAIAIGLILYAIGIFISSTATTPEAHQTLNLLIGFGIAMDCDAVLFGAVGGAKWDNVERDKRPEAALLRLRKDLDLFANLRPAVVLDALSDSSSLKSDLVKGLDILIIRELTSGVYFGQPRGISKINETESKAVDTQLYTTSEVNRVSRVAFDLAKLRNNKVTSVEKSNVMETGLFWKQTVTDLHKKEYSDVNLEHMLADNCAMQLVRYPKQFDVILTDNLFGDLLSDTAAMLTGSLGMLPSAALGPIKENGTRAAMYEPVHGSAPDIAGQSKANPLAMIMSFAMMLKYSFDMQEDSQMVEQAVQNVLLKGLRTADIKDGAEKIISTQEMGNAVIEELKILSGN